MRRMTITRLEATPRWSSGAALAGRSFRAEVGYDDAPFGVGYLVATWVQR